MAKWLDMLAEGINNDVTIILLYSVVHLPHGLVWISGGFFKWYLKYKSGISL